MVIASAVAELERNLIVDRVRLGPGRARLEGRQLGGRPIEIDRLSRFAIELADRALARLGKAYRISRTSVARALKQAGRGYAKILCFHRSAAERSA
jgi:DNA invertase Pin-like site-specific DNA recombinase